MPSKNAREATPSNSLLWRLPLEIRECIYYYVISQHLDSLVLLDILTMDHFEPDIPASHNSTRLPFIHKKHQLYAPLLKACPLYQAVALRVLFSRFAIHFALLTLIKGISESHRLLIRHMGIRIILIQPFSDYKDYMTDTKKGTAWIADLIQANITLSHLLPNLGKLELHLQVDRSLITHSDSAKTGQRLSRALAPLDYKPRVNVWFEYAPAPLSSDDLIKPLQAYQRNGIGVLAWEVFWPESERGRTNIGYGGERPYRAIR